MMELHIHPLSCELSSFWNRLRGPCRPSGEAGKSSPRGMSREQADLPCFFPGIGGGVGWGGGRTLEKGGASCGYQL